jgi:hypothetical protein
MAGTPEREEHGIPERIRQVMVQFNVDEEKARLLLGCGAILASELITKWKNNLRKIQVRKAKIILELVERAQRGDPQALEDAKAELKKSVMSRVGSTQNPRETNYIC